MELKEMTIEELEARKLAIAEEVEADGSDLDALEEEVRAIKAELEARKAEEAKKAEIRSAVAAGAGTVIQKFEEEKKTVMNNEEIRNSKEYVDAFAEYLKKNDDTECRALLTENVSGQIPVPTIVEDIVRTAWEREGIMSRVRKAYVRGNLKVGFEISGTDAQLHTEGGAAVAEENLVLGVVTLTPISIKKWISLSDEVVDMKGEAFLRYIYDEITYRIAKKAADELIAKIEAAGTVSTTTAPGIAKLTEATLGVGTIAKAIAMLSDSAANPVIMMNKLTWGAFKAAQYANNFSVDPFEGLPVEFNNTITAYSAASTGDTYVIVGDLDQGALANFPAGDGIAMKYDDTTLMTSDLVRILGRQYVGLGVVAPGAFVKVTK